MGLSRFGVKAYCRAIILGVALGGTALSAPVGADDDILLISREAYADKLAGFWLGQSIANWTGLTTEMVRVEPPLFTDADWGKQAEPAIWGKFPFHAGTIDFFLLTDADRAWGSDDDTDIEYMYQYLMEKAGRGLLTASAIRDGWLTHIYTNDDAPLSPNTFKRENYLWVANERAHELMQAGMLPPDTSKPENNEVSDMIDAQLTTEIFGLFAPARPDVARHFADLPISVSAHGDAAAIAHFYVTMHALASRVDQSLGMKEQTQWLAETARMELPDGSTPAAMYDFVLASYLAAASADDWEQARDAVYERYQASSTDRYVYKQGFDAGINFAASLISLFFGEGDLKRTIQIGTLAGWDSDNPTATWGGLIGFMLGRKGVEDAFGQGPLTDAYWISRTRRGFPDHTPNEAGEDSFTLMAERGVKLIDRIVVNELGGDIQSGNWHIPLPD
jgi:hypothetical protein